MIYGVYSIYDAAAEVFTAPTIDISDASAVRAFQQAVANSGSVMNFKPEDFALYQIGTFDVETGALQEMVPPSRLVVGSDGSIQKVI
uniref:Nonstructural protein n=1 Tax=Dulem virus 192 TaxID=3145669 RepID=A0AAU8B6E5_9VIRU